MSTVTCARRGASRRRNNPHLLSPVGTRKSLLRLFVKTPLRLAIRDAFPLRRAKSVAMRTHSIAPQLDRNAIIGSIRDARHAGTYAATAATAASSTPIATNVAGSPGVTPNNRLSKALDKTRDAAI